MNFVPTWYDPAKVGRLRKPELDRAAMTGAEYARANGIPPVTKGSGQNVLLAVIDQQVDFIDPDGNLPVAGAVADTDRLNRWIYNNVGIISHIVASLDTHYLFQPFHRMNWQAGSRPAIKPNGQLYKEGENPLPFTLISLKDLRDDVWRPVRFPAEMQRYLGKLEADAKKTLCIWPFHCLLGTPGHAFDPSFMEAVFFHAAARMNQYDATVKGMAQLSEHYGILMAEVQFPEDPNTQVNTRVLGKWQEADRVYFAGQAKSHCVLETLNQVVSIFNTQGRDDLLSKLYVLRDCMSSVPDIRDAGGKVIVPFDQIAEARFAELESMGVKFVKSTDPVKL